MRGLGSRARRDYALSLSFSGCDNGILRVLRGRADGTDQSSYSVAYEPPDTFGVQVRRKQVTKVEVCLLYTSPSPRDS